MLADEAVTEYQVHTTMYCSEYADLTSRIPVSAVDYFLGLDVSMERGWPWHIVLSSCSPASMKDKDTYEHEYRLQMIHRDEASQRRDRSRHSNVHG